jgi:hypothetical protein
MKHGTLLKVRGGMKAKLADGGLAIKSGGPWMNAFKVQGFISGRFRSIMMTNTTKLTGDISITLETVDGQTFGQARAFKAKDLEKI